MLSPTNQAAAIYAFTGLGFSGANLILAKLLPPRDYAELALVVSILGVAAPLAPLGADGIINRRLLGPSRRLLGRACATAAVVAALAALASRTLYGLDLVLLGALVPGLFAGGVVMVAAAGFQRFQRFTPALLIDQSANLFLIGASLLMILPALRVVWFPVALIAIGYTATAALGWTALFRQHADPGAPEPPFPWGEALYYAGVSGAGLLLLQAERLLIPRVLSMEDLASFGVLAAVVIAPYRTLQMGATFSVLPRLRALASPAERRRLLWHEVLGLGLAVAVGSAVLILLAPWVFELIFGDKFRFPSELILAAVLAGIARVLGGLAEGAATALCTTRELGVLNVLTWLSTAVAFVAGSVGARWGLIGLVYGIAIGWITLAAVYAHRVLPHLRTED